MGNNTQTVVHLRIVVVEQQQGCSLVQLIGLQSVESTVVTEEFDLAGFAAEIE